MGCRASLVAFTLAVLLALPAGAMTLTVMSNADSGGTCPGATCTLRQAIATAGSGDTIDFAAGITNIGLTSGELALSKNLTISGPGASVLTVQRTSGNFRIFNITGSFTVAISGLTIDNGNLPGQTNGGGISNSGSLTLTDVTLSHNTTFGSGAGLYNSGSSMAMIIGCTFSNNSIPIQGGAAGGIYNQGTMTVDNSNISNNGGRGVGGVWNAGTITINGSTIAGNQVSGSGGILNDTGAMATVTNSTISGNFSSQGTGGISNFGGTLTINNSTISGNTASGTTAVGGGITNSGTLTINNSTITGNSKTFNGGGIYNTATGMTTIANSTIAGNTAVSISGSGQGGGIYSASGGTVKSKSTVIALNTSGTGDFGGGPDIFGELTSQDFNLIGNNSNATITPAQPADQIGTAGSPIDPLLGPLQDNGGPTFTRALLAGSPAIDKGIANGLTTDQRGAGFPRTLDYPTITNAVGGDGTDIGAFEYGAPLVPVTLSRKMHAGVPFDIGLPLTNIAGIECRRGSGANFNDHQVVASFLQPVTVGSVAVMSSDGMATGNVNIAGADVIVSLSTVTNAQTLTITLTNVSDGMNTSNVVIPMAVLRGDVNADRSVNAADVSQTKSQTGQPVDNSTFRNDVVPDGAINSADVSLVKASSGTGLMPILIGTFFSGSPYQLNVVNSPDGFIWNLVKAAAYTPAPNHQLRDPSVIKLGDALWTVFTNGIGETNDLGNVDYFTLIKSTDGGQSWSLVQDIPTIAGAPRTWAPEWFLDEDGTAHVFVAVAIPDNSRIWLYEMHPLDQSNFAGGWSSPALVRTDTYDGTVIKKGGLYYLIYTQGGSLAMSTSSTVDFGHYTDLGEIKFNGVSSPPGSEGPNVFATEHGYAMVFVKAGVGLSFATSTDLFNWSAATPIPLPIPLDHGSFTRAGD